MSRYAAPGAFLLAVTVAVLGIHYGLRSQPGEAVLRRSTTVTLHRDASHPKRPDLDRRGTARGARRQLLAIAVRAQTTVAALERLNPGVSTTALRVGQKIRVH